MPLDLDQRQSKVLPAGWFPPSLTDTPVLRAVLAMPQAVGVWLLSFLDYVQAQTRLGTTSGGWLDLAALDYFGLRIRRRIGQSDAALRARIVAELLRRRSSREAMRQMLLELTGMEPRIFEPSRPADTGAWNGPAGYGVAGAWGTMELPATAFIDVYRSPAAGIPYVAGWGEAPWGWNEPSRGRWSSLDDIAGALTDADILSSINSTRAAGVIIWVRFST
jgi:hypothetical protein